jgi:hypothetical protein
MPLVATVACSISVCLENCDNGNSMYLANGPTSRNYVPFTYTICLLHLININTGAARFVNCHTVISKWGEITDTFRSTSWLYLQFCNGSFVTAQKQQAEPSTELREDMKDQKEFDWVRMLL